MTSAARILTPDLRQQDLLRQRIGAAYARIAPRKLIAYLTGCSPTAVWNRANGVTPFRPAELADLARSPDARVNPYHPVAEMLSAIAAARRRLDLQALCASLRVRLHREQQTDGLEDESQLEVAEALAALELRGADELTDRERELVLQRLHRHHRNLVAHAAEVLALAGDIEAMMPWLQPGADR